MPRFVILEHDSPSLHWDLMLEAGAILQTWRLENPPNPGLAIRAEKSFDHRLAYLEYEGPISGNRGRVRRWEHGRFEYEIDSEHCLVLRLLGSRLSGAVTLTRTADIDWLFTLTTNDPP